MHFRTLKADLVLLLAAAIWGFAFVAQRVGMDYVGPFTFNAIRFALGALVLLPFLFLQNKMFSVSESESSKLLIPGACLTGTLIFLGASFQQIGIIYTTAGKSGFITGLYVILVPILGLFWGQRTSLTTWLGAILAVAGLYFLSVTETITLAKGDLLVLISAFFWASQVQAIGWLSNRTRVLTLAFGQFIVCSFLSFLAALWHETIVWEQIKLAWIPILYAGVFSVGVAYTLQVVAQRQAPPAQAAIILSLEAVFAVLGGWLFLRETLNHREIFGCLLMFMGMILSQLQFKMEPAKSPKVKSLPTEEPTA